MTQKEYFFINILKEISKIEIEQIEAFKPLIKYIVDYNTQLVDEIFYKKSLQDKELIKLYKNLTALTGYEFMGYKRPLITEDIPEIHPDINKFLKFSYTDLSIQDDRNLLTKKLVSGLEKAMTNPLIASILGVSAGLVSICFYEDTLENGEISGDYFSDNPNIRIGNFSKFLRSEDPEVFKANIAYIIHELTHYVNDVVFQYSSEPFAAYDIQSWEVFNQITDEIWNIYDQNPDYISILGSYDSEQYTIEIPALYMEALTLETLSSRNIDRVLIEHIKLKNYMEGPLMSACNKFISWKNLLQDAYGKAENFLDRGMEIEICKIQELKLKEEQNDNLFPHREPSILIKGTNYILDTIDLIINIGDEDIGDKHILSKKATFVLEEFNATYMKIFDLAGLNSTLMQSDLNLELPSDS